MTAVTRADLRGLVLAARKATTDPARRRGLEVQAYAMARRPRPWVPREDWRIKRERLRAQAQGQPRDEAGRFAPRG